MLIYYNVMKILSNILNIDGVKLYPSKIIKTGQGDVLHFLNINSLNNQDLCDDGFSYIRKTGVSAGEIYFSECYKWLCKGWKIHSNQDQLFLCPFGKICVCIVDLRENSISKYSFGHIILGKEDNFSLLKIPRGLHYTFFSVDYDVSLLCNAPSGPHDKKDNAKFTMSDDQFKIYSNMCNSLISQLKAKDK